MTHFLQPLIHTLLVWTLSRDDIVRLDLSIDPVQQITARVAVSLAEARHHGNLIFSVILATLSIYGRCCRQLVRLREVSR
jgi:hypothetical protein